MVDKFSFWNVFDCLSNEQLEQAVIDFLTEQKLGGEFLVWLEKWKSLHTK